MKNLIIRFTAAVLLCAGTLGSMPASSADTYPSRPIKLIIPFPPGGGSDVVGRVLGQWLSTSMGQQVVVENRVGASGTIGTAMIAKAAPDGYTIGLIISNHFVNPALFKKLPYDSVKDFAPIMLIANGLFALVVHPSVPIKSMQELIALAKAQPGKLNIGIASTGTIGHLAYEQLKAQHKVELTPVLYKGAGPAVADLLGGHTQVMFSSYPSVQQYIQSGRLRALAVTSEKRSTVAPEIPTAVEAGAAGLILNDWWGLVAPAGTDKAIISRLHDELAKALASPEVMKRLREVGAEIVANTPDEFAASIPSGIAKWSKVIRDAGIEAE